MCGSYFNEKALPPVKGYDIHIYFENDGMGRWEANSLARQIIRKFPGAVKSQAPQEVGIVGPHLTRNVEVDIKPEAFGKVVSWLQRANPGLSILVHPKTGDELADHLGSSLWLGKQLPLNDKFFKEWAARHTPINGNKPKTNKKEL